MPRPLVSIIGVLPSHFDPLKGLLETAGFAVSTAMERRACVAVTSHGALAQMEVPTIVAGPRTSLEALLAGIRAMAPAPVADAGGDEMAGEGVSAERIRRAIQQVAPTESSVLITGETGTGKELVAAQIHRLSRRKDSDMVCINCAAIPDTLLESELFGYERGAFSGAQQATAGKLEQANHGSLFLDEIGDMSPLSQAKILRVLDSRQVQRLGGKHSYALDVRIIAATNQQLEDLAAEGRFRKDLYYRLNVFRIHLPPLRERREDIARIVRHYIEAFNRRFGSHVEGLTGEALAVFQNYDWPGNVRELKNLLEAVFVSCSSREISVGDFPAHFLRHLGTAETGETECNRLLRTLRTTRWNKSEAAKQLQWSRMTLYRKMARYQITDPVGK